MYCKKCGKNIPDDSSFCSFCGEKLNIVNNAEANVDSISLKINKDSWQTTNGLQWKKPIIIRCVQILFLSISSFFLLYGVINEICGGKQNSFNYSLDNHRVDVYDLLELFDCTYTFIESHCYNGRCFTTKYGEYPEQSLRCEGCSSWSIFEEDNRNAVAIFRKSMLFYVILPSMVIFFFVVLWMSKIRFPKSSDMLPRDIADKIEIYRWNGMSFHKYVLYQKGDKYGVIDAAKYKPLTEPIYDSAIWRYPGQTIDVSIGKEKCTINIQDIDSKI
jgi:hypothetical protein